VELELRRTAALLILYANAVFTRVSLRLQHPEHVAPGVHDNVRCRRTFAIAARGIDLTVGSTMALVSVIVALLIIGDRGRHPAALSGALLILNGFHLTSET